MFQYFGTCLVSSLQGQVCVSRFNNHYRVLLRQNFLGTTYFGPFFSNYFAQNLSKSSKLQYPGALLTHFVYGPSFHVSPLDRNLSLNTSIFSGKKYISDLSFFRYIWMKISETDIVLTVGLYKPLFIIIWKASAQSLFQSWSSFAYLLTCDINEKQNIL